MKKMPFTDSQLDLYQNGDKNLEERGETDEISFISEEQSGRLEVNKPRVTSVNKLQVAYLK